MIKLGEVDIAILNPIYRECIKLNKEHNWNYSFKEDSGSYETMMQFIENEWNRNLVACYPPMAKNWDDMQLCNAPDIMDFNSKIIIEYEEESKPGKRMGKLGKKGHWSECKKDTQRDSHYKKAGFRLCKIWESEYKKADWKNKLFHFLSDCYCYRDTALYLDMYLTGKELRKALKSRK